MDFTNPKPQCKLTGTDGNIFALTARASKALEKSGLTESIKQMQDRVLACKSYYEALHVLSEYVDVY